MPIGGNPVHLQASINIEGEVMERVDSGYQSWKYSFIEGSDVDFIQDKEYVYIDVHIDDMRLYRLYVTSARRIFQDAEIEFASGGLYYSEVNTVVVPEVNPEVIEPLIQKLIQDHYFQDAQPLVTE